MVDDQIGLRDSVIDGGDDDYLGIEIYSSADRFAGTTRIYAGLNELSEFAARIAGFPRRPRDEVRYTFGTLNRKFAGGFCELRFECRDSAGHVLVTVHLEDDNRQDHARFSFPAEAAGIDRLLASYAQLIDRVLARPSSLECGKGRTKVLRYRDSCERRTSAFG